MRSTNSLIKAGKTNPGHAASIKFLMENDSVLNIDLQKISPTAMHACSVTIFSSLLPNSAIG